MSRKTLSALKLPANDALIRLVKAVKAAESFEQLLHDFPEGWAIVRAEMEIISRRHKIRGRYSAPHIARIRVLGGGVVLKYLWLYYKFLEKHKDEPWAIIESRVVGPAIGIT